VNLDKKFPTTGYKYRPEIRDSSKPEAERPPVEPDARAPKGAEASGRLEDQTDYDVCPRQGVGYYAQ